MKKNVTLGERRIIETLQSRLDHMPKMPIPFGDDVSAYDCGKGRFAVLKTDMLVDKTDVPRGMDLWHAARKAIVMNVSDFAAKGVKPLSMLVSLGLPRHITQKEVEQIGDGLNAGAREYDSYIVGGDTGEASDLVISVSVFGLAKKEKLMLRSGAKPGDVVAVTGCFGKTSAGLKIMLSGLKIETESHRALAESVLTPHARLQEGLALSNTGAVTASIDSSDGLAWSLHEIAKASGVGFAIQNIPIDKTAVAFANLDKLDPLELALYGGEEYELVITADQRLWERVKKAVKRVGGDLFPIGKVTHEKSILFAIDGKTEAIEPRGYEHFR